MKNRKTVRRKMQMTLMLQILISVLFILYTIFMSAYQNYNNLSNRYFQIGEQMLTSVEALIGRLSEANLFPVLQAEAGSDNTLIRSLREENITGNFKFYQHFNQTARSRLSPDGAELIALYDLEGNGVAIQSGQSEYRICFTNDQAQWYSDQRLYNTGVPHIIPVGELLGTGMPNADGRFLCQARGIMDVSTFQIVGVCLAGVSTESLEKLFLQLRLSTGQTFAVYQHDRLLFHTGEPEDEAYTNQASVWKLPRGQSEQEKDLFRVSNKLYLTNTIRHKDGYTIILRTPFSDITGQAHKVQLTFTVIISLILIAMVCLIAGNIQDILQAMNRLIEACNAFELDRRDEIPDTDFPQEIRILFESFNRMSNRIYHLVQEVLKKQQEQQETEMQLLRTQVNPHYLYNTLEMIHMRAYLQKNNDVADMAELLGQNLQYGLRNTNQEVTLREELEQVQIYLKILSYQYGDRIRTNFFVAEELLECRIIKLLFQPIIENSIIHGIDSSDQILHIEIIAYREGDAVVLQISDDGCGMEPEKLEELQASIRQLSSSGIGFRNVCRRILLKYGEQYQAEIRSQRNMGSTVTLYLPYRTESEEETEALCCEEDPADR